MIGIWKCTNIVKMAIRRIYKNLYYNEEEGVYEFRDATTKKQVVSQESYIMIYIMELLKDLNSKFDPNMGA